MADAAQADRLEWVREEHAGFETKKGFWQKLCEGWDEEEAVSYASVRNYHGGDKTAPAVYFARIAEVFQDVQLKWLVTGRGPRTAQEAEEKRQREQSEPDQDFREAVADRHPWFRHLDFDVQQKFLAVLRKLERQATGGISLGELDSEDVREERLSLVDDLAALLILPLRSWGFVGSGLLFDDDTQSVELHHLRAINSYVDQALGGLRTIVKEQPGDPLDDRPGAPLARIRRALDQQTGRMPEPGDAEDPLSPSSAEIDRASRAQEAVRSYQEERDRQVDEEVAALHDAHEKAEEPKEEE